MKLKEWVKEIHENAKAHGWWDNGERNFGELLMLIVSEASEALEEYRNGHAVAETYYSGKQVAYAANGDQKGIMHHTSQVATEKCAKMEGVPSELADIVIRVCDICGHYGIDLEAVMAEKHAYNKSRPYKHGGKKC